MQPFSLSCHDEFEIWAQNKLSLYTDDSLSVLMKPTVISADGFLSASQLVEIQHNISRYNFSIYRIERPEDFTTQSLAQLGQSLGLENLDANICAEEDLISVITDSSQKQDQVDRKQRYIPYSNKALSWHTDGYYNPGHQRVRAFILHCLQPAEGGGENSLIDPEIIYLMLRKQDPVYIEALSRDDVMRIPENRQDGVCIRAETASAVFQCDHDGEKLDMRFSQRKRHIIWRDDTVTRSALSSLNELLNNESAWRIKVRLRAGEGIISNNVLHRREAYRDTNDNKRVFLRARYYNPVPYSSLRGPDALSE